jgi:hypothetical protein
MFEAFFIIMGEPIKNEDDFIFWEKCKEYLQDK